MLNKLKATVANRTTQHKNSNNRYIVALDIGTVFVKALIGQVKGSEIEIVGVGRAHQAYTDMQAGAIADIESVVQNCNQALAIAEEQSGVSVRSGVVGIAGELVKGTTSTIHCNRKDPNKEIDLDEMEQIVQLVQERAEARARKTLAWELGGKQVDVRLVNSALVGISIDGYVVTNPIGFKGRDVVVQLYTAFAPLIHIAALERTASELDLDLLAVAAEPFAVARSVIGDNPNTSMSAVLMDIGGGTTDIAVVNEGGVQGTKMFGIGGRAFTKSIEKDLNITFEMAEKLKLNLAESKNPEQHEAVIEALDKVSDVWIGGVELALSEFDNLDHLPHQVLLCGGGSSLESVMKTLKETNWYSQLPFAKKPKVNYITPDQVIGITDKSGMVNDHTFVTAMGLLRVGLDTIEQDGINSSGSVKDRLDRILQV